MLIRVLKKIKSLFIKNNNDNYSERLIKLNKYASIHESSIVENLNLDMRNPLDDKLYLSVGKDCVLHGNVIFESQKGEVSIGNRVFLGGCTIIARTKVEFENDIFVAWGTYFYDHDSHSLDYRERRKDIVRQLDDYRTNKPNFIHSKDWEVVTSKPIKICSDAWIGMNVTVLKGVTIGQGAVVGAGSVVTKDVLPWTVVAGNPAKLVKEIPLELRPTNK